MSLGPLYVLLGEVSVQAFCPVFNWIFAFVVCTCVSSLYILEIKPLSEVSLANIFSHTVGSLFIFLKFSLVVHKLFNLMKSICLFFPLHSCSRGHISENIAAWHI